jgi:multidrug transporter EmrE-like cation transporter
MKYLLVFIVLILVEVYALYSLKKQRLLIGIIGFIIVAIILYYLLKENHIGIVNHTWNIFSSMLIFVIGYLYFFEKLTTIQIIGIIAGFIGLFLMNYDYLVKYTIYKI